MDVPHAPDEPILRQPAGFGACHVEHGAVRRNRPGDRGADLEMEVDLAVLDHLVQNLLFLAPGRDLSLHGQAAAPTRVPQCVQKRVPGRTGVAQRVQDLMLGRRVVPCFVRETGISGSVDVLFSGPLATVEGPKAARKSSAS